MLVMRIGQSQGRRSTSPEQETDEQRLVSKQQGNKQEVGKKQHRPNERSQRSKVRTREGRKQTAKRTNSQQPEKSRFPQAEIGNGMRGSDNEQSRPAQRPGNPCRACSGKGIVQVAWQSLCRCRKTWSGLTCPAYSRCFKRPLCEYCFVYTQVLHEPERFDGAQRPLRPCVLLNMFIASYHAQQRN